jgi:succinyl-diaminopimelate desuccinylase
MNTTTASTTTADPVTLLQELIRCPSVTPAEGGALLYLASVLAGAGFTVDRPVFSQAGTPDIENLYARIGEGGPCLVFAGHTDVVPPGDEARWRHGPFSGDVADGLVWGRGAVDMKGAIAAFLAATLRRLAGGRPLAGSIAFLITGDEEGPAVNGTVKLLDWVRARGERMDHCLLGEPTNPARLGEMMKIGRRGSLNATLTLSGTQGHVAYPHLADNPLRRLPVLMQALTAPLDQGTAHFDPSNLEIVSVDTGNPACNVIPGEARIRLNVRFNDLWTPVTLAAEIERRARTAAGERVSFAFEPTNAVAFLTEPGPFVTLVAEAIAAETGTRPALSTTGGTSDARFIKDHCPVVEFGLVGDTMHQIDERAPVADLERLTAIYARIIEAYFGAASTSSG